MTRDDEKLHRTDQTDEQAADEQAADVQAAGSSQPPAHDGDEVEEWGEESFPASDPPQNWAGHDGGPR